jgi:endo-1,4-beta-xylanase
MSKKSKLLAFPSMLSLLAVLLVSINTGGHESKIGGTLRSAAQTHGFLVGASAELKPLETDPAYAQTLAQEYNVLTPENAMKFEPLRPTRSRFAFADADKIVNFTSVHGMKLRGHTLVWHERLPRWLVDGNFSSDEVSAILREHIETVMGHYRGRVYAWDVVNEAIDDQGGLRQTFWSNMLGSDYIAQAFTLARAADPQATLLYNDYGGEALGVKSESIYGLLKSLKERGVPIDGVGLQSHFLLEQPPRMSEVAANVRRLAALGLEIQITELDVRIFMPPNENKLQDQAQIYRAYLDACLAVANCNTFVTWGFTDKYSWIPQFFPGYGAALPFDEAYRQKPAHHALVQAFYNSRRR